MKLKQIFLLSAFAGIVQNVDAQCLFGNCLIDVQANRTTICVGDSVILGAFTGTQSLGNDFNNSTIGTGWVTNNNVVNFNNPCGPGLDGTPHVWFGSAAGTGTRLLQTVDFDCTLGGNICFDFKMATQGQGSPCEGPDEADEGVSLQYSINGGATWVDITYFSPSGVQMPSNPGGNNSVAPTGGTPFTVWDTYTFAIPPGAMTPATRFRWFQPYNTSASNDHWGIDNVSVVTNQFTATVPGFTWMDNGQLVNGPRVEFPTATTTYTARWINGTDTCTESVTVVVNPVPAAPTFVAPVVCAGQPFSLTPTNPFPGATYYWSGTNGVSSNSVPYNSIGGPAWNNVTMNLYAIANGCTSATHSEVITVKTPPNVSVSGKTLECEGVPVMLTASPNTLDSVVWNDGHVGPINMVMPGGTYIATGYFDGCTDTGMITINIVPNPLTINGNTPFCANRTRPISVTGGKDSYIWNGVVTNDSTFILTGSTPNPTILAVESANGCVRIDTIHFVTHAVPEASFEPTSYCGGLTIPFINTTTIDSSGGSTVNSYIWNFGDGSTSTDVHPEHAFASSGTYPMSLIATSSQACRDTFVVDFRVHPKPEADFIFSPLCFGKAIFSDSTQLGDTTLATYHWSFAEITDTFNVEMFEHTFDEGITSLTVHYSVVDEFGCADDTIRVVQIPESPQFSQLPNIITSTPQNSTIKINPLFDECYDYSIRFFNRWGQKVFEITDSAQEFNGTSSTGQKLEDGVYYYVIFANGDKVLSGNVTIISG